MKNEVNMTEGDLDRELASPAQLKMRSAVQALPEEPLSLAWRSELNTRLHAEVARRRKLNLFGWVWKPTAGLAVAGTLAIVFVMRTPGLVPASAHRGVENALVNSYVDSTASWEVAGDGITVNEAKDTTSQATPFDWDQEDVGATL